ncbi:elongation factor 1-beta [Apiospora arundinis]
MSTSAGATPEIESAFEVRGPVVVAFVNSTDAHGNDAQDENRPESQYIETDPANKQVLLEAHYSGRFAFFKLRIPVCLKRLDKTFLYFHIPLHHVSSLSCATEDATDQTVQGKLNGSGSGGITRLDLCLHTPGHLIVPAQDSLEPKRAATARAIDSLTSLATSLVFSLYVQHTVFSKARLRLLEASISPLIQPPTKPSTQTSTEPQAPTDFQDLQDLRSLYNGKGGKRWIPIDDGTASTASDSAASTVAVDTPPGYGPPPPQYDEVAPRTPEPKRHGKRPRHRVSSGSSDSSEARPSKRSGVPSYLDDEDAPAYREKGNLAYPEKSSPSFPDDKGGPSSTTRETLFAQMELLVRGQHAYIQQQQTHILQQQEHIKQQGTDIKRLLATTAELEHQVAVMQERLDEAGSKVDTLDAGIVELGQDLDEVKCSIPDTEEMVQDLGGKIEHEVREQVEQRLQDVFSRIGSVLTD